jgi:nucleoid-associated protein YgaU
VSVFTAFKCMVDRLFGNQDEVHVVVPGDTLSGIAQKRLHDSRRWPDIAGLNNLKSPYRIYPGQVLRVPRRVK